MDRHPDTWTAETVKAGPARAKANPGMTNIASAGIGTPGHMASELFQLLTGLDLLDVPYRGGAPALTDLLAGHVHVMFDNLPTSLTTKRRQVEVKAKEPWHPGSELM
jgi:tripartite-type tricarboxylate transporter receptor subunit TctC